MALRVHVAFFPWTFGMKLTPNLMREGKRKSRLLYAHTVFMHGAEHALQTRCVETKHRPLKKNRGAISLHAIHSVSFSLNFSSVHSPPTQVPLSSALFSFRHFTTHPRIALGIIEI